MHRQPAAMITASHNPWFDNGVKIFAPGGPKLSDEIERSIEEALDREPACRRLVRRGGPRRACAAPVRRGLLVDLPDRRTERLRIVLDCANGAMFEAAPQVIRGLGADVIAIHAEPNGQNINDHCGATHPEDLRRAVIENEADLGLAFDGDGDRVIAVDHAGDIVDGDRMIALAALQLRDQGELTNNTVVVTVMSNLGFHKAMATSGIDVVTTPVGDRSVLEALDAGDFAVGGEQSGHIIYRHLATTGDGLLAGLRLAEYVRTTGRPLADLAGKRDDVVSAGARQRRSRRPSPCRRRGVGGRDRSCRGRAERRRAHPRATERHRAADSRDGGSTDTVDGPIDRRWPGGDRASQARLTRRYLPGSVAWTAMCGIIGIVSRPSQRPVPESAELLAHLDRAVAADTLSAAAAAVRQCDELLKGVPGARALVGRYELGAAIAARLDQIDARIAEAEGRIESDDSLDVEDQERLATELIDLRDAVWAVRFDRLRTAREVEALAGRDSTVAAIAGYLAVQQSLSALDRLEVRGRDSAGLHLFVWNHGISPSDAVVRRMLAERNIDPLFQNGSVRVSDQCLGFVYKAAKEIGELGDNTRALRAAIAGDDLLRLALSNPTLAWPCWGTPAGPASGSSARPTAIR
jgi:hypothetical protein